MTDGVSSTEQIMHLPFPKSRYCEQREWFAIKCISVCYGCAGIRAFSVVDSGFANDVEELSRKMNSIISANNMYVGIYRYGGLEEKCQ